MIKKYKMFIENISNDERLMSNIKSALIDLDDIGYHTKTVDATVNIGIQIKNNNNSLGVYSPSSLNTINETDVSDTINSIIDFLKISGIHDILFSYTYTINNYGREEKIRSKKLEFKNRPSWKLVTINIFGNKPK